MSTTAWLLILPWLDDAVVRHVVDHSRVVVYYSKEHPLPPPGTPPLPPVGRGFTPCLSLGEPRGRRQGIQGVKDGGEGAQGGLLGDVDGQNPLVVGFLMRDGSAQGLLGLDDVDLLVRVDVHAAWGQAREQGSGL